MKVIKNLKEIVRPYENAVVTIGNFDGVHKGHQNLLEKVRKKADRIKGTAVAITFEPHPMKVLQKKEYPQQITSFDQKVELLSKTNLDILICIPFTKKFASITAQSFVKDLLVQKIGMKVIIVGKDYAFGKNREGNIDFLKSISNTLGFKVIVAKWKTINGIKSERISSTKIREIILGGNVEEAKKLLGHHFQIRGKVVRGRNRGATLLGFPTANIHPHDSLCPKTGVYAVIVESPFGNHVGVANIGYSPTFDDHIFTVEVHVLDFNKNIYGQKIRVNFVSRLRDEQKFSNISELSKQILKDVETTRKMMN